MRRLEGWYLQLVDRYFGKEAAADSAIRLVAKCGKVPFREFRELFNVERGTIRHPHDYKRAFARKFGVHSECVARRIARDLWELRKRNPKSKYVARPEWMDWLVRVERTFKVPCEPGQEAELKMLADFPEEPSGIYRAWDKAHTPAGPARAELTQAEQQEQELAEQFEQERARMFAAEVYGPKGYESNPALNLPTPIHFVCALGI